MVPFRRKQQSNDEIRWDKVIEGHTWLTISSIGEKSCTYDDLVMEFMKFELSFGGGMFIFDKESDPSYLVTQKMVEKDIEFLLNNDFIIQENNLYHVTAKGQEAVDFFVEKWQFINKLANKILSPTAPPKASLVIHLILGILKLVGFALTGLVGLLGDGIDSAIDGVSSLIVSISMRYKKEKFASYFLLLLMLASGVGILVESIRQIVKFFLEDIILQQDVYAIVVAVLSIFLSLILYTYQRIVGYTSKNLTVIVQSEDSRNHILVGFLVLIGVIAGIYDFMIIDGIVGVLIGFLILFGCYAIFKDLRALERGESIDFEKYKLGLWKSFDRLRTNIIGTWVMFNIQKGNNSYTNLEPEFLLLFQPQFLKIIEIELKQKDKELEDEKKTLKFYHEKESLKIQVESLLEKKYLIEDKGIFSLTKEGENALNKQFEKIRRRHKRHARRSERRLKKYN